MPNKNPTVKVYTDLDHNLKFEKELLEISRTRLTVIGDGREVMGMPLREIERAYIEEGLGIGKLIIKARDGNETEVAYFTKNRIGEFRRLSGALNAYVSTRRLSFSPEEDSSRRKMGRIGTLKWLINFLQPYKARLAVGVALSIIVAGFSLVPPYMLKVLIDSVLLSSTHPSGLFEELTAILVAAYAMSTVVQIAQNYVLNTVGQRIVNDLRARVYEQVMTLSTSSIDKFTTGRIISRLTNDVGNTQWLMAFGLPTVIVNFLTLAGIGIILFSMDIHLAVFVLLPVPIVVFALVSYRARAHKAYHKNWRRSADVTSMLADTVPSHFIIKSFAKENFENSRINLLLDRLYESQKVTTKLNLSYWPAIGFLTSVSTVIIWWVGGNQVIAGTIQLGVVTAFISYMAQFYNPINSLSNILPFVQQAITSGDRLREIIDAEPEIRNAARPKRPALSGDIEFRNVWFGYEAALPVVESFNLRLKAGHTVGIVGRSGSGKSTISKLMMRFYDADRGSISISGCNVKDIELNYLRDRIAYVPQDVVLFDNTVSYNIKYGASRDATHSEIIGSCRAARIHKEIMELPFAYDTNLGERGSSLSGGQRQRLSVARAVIKKPDVVILDEATSNLDATSEKEIYSAVLNLAKGKTTIFVTHNINEVMNSDSVLMMKKGKVIEQGTPKRLIGMRGEFYRMFRTQIAKGDYEIEDFAAENPSIESYLPDMIGEGEAVRVDAGRRGSVVNVDSDRGRLEGLTPKLPFPISNPNYVILHDAAGEEVLMFEDYSILDEKSMQALQKAVLLSTFKPIITVVREINIRGDELEWKVVCDGKDATISTRGRRNVMLLGDKIVLGDIRDNIYEIYLDRLDARSFAMVAETI